MQNLRHPLAAMAASILIMSVISGINPGNLAAFADSHEDEFTESLGEHSQVTLETDDDRIDLKVEIEDGDLDDGEHNIVFECAEPEIREEFAGALEVEDGEGEFETEIELEEGEYSGCDIGVGDLTASFPAFAIITQEDDDDEDDEEHEEEDDDNNGRSDKDDDDDRMTQTLGNSSKASLKVDDDEAELEVEIEDGDLGDGTYDVVFACASPDIEEEFAEALEVDDGEGEFEAELDLSNGTYTGCEVDAGGLGAEFPSFSIMSREDDDDDEDEEERDDDEEEDGENGHEAEFESRLKADENGVEIKVEAEGLNMTDGSYDAVLECQDPDLSLTLEDAFEVEDGEGEFEEEIGLANGTYSGCEIVVEGETIASFDNFTVDEESEDEQERKVKETREERKKRIIERIADGRSHVANLSSPGDYRPGWNYTLEADGMATSNENATDEADAAADVDMSVWKSNRAIILLEVVGGAIEIDDQEYSVRVGYAIYSIQNDVIKIVALATNDDGDILRLKLRGAAVNESDQFPMESGSIGMLLGGTAGGSGEGLEEWSLTLEGTVHAS